MIDLVPGSAAADGGLELGDVIVAIDGEPMRHPGELQSPGSGRGAGDHLELDVERRDVARRRDARPRA